MYKLCKSCKNPDCMYRGAESNQDIVCKHYMTTPKRACFRRDGSCCMEDVVLPDEVRVTWHDLGADLDRLIKEFRKPEENEPVVVSYDLRYRSYSIYFGDRLIGHITEREMVSMSNSIFQKINQDLVEQNKFEILCDFGASVSMSEVKDSYFREDDNYREVGCFTEELKPGTAFQIKSEWNIEGDDYHVVIIQRDPTFESRILFDCRFEGNYEYWRCFRTHKMKNPTRVEIWIKANKPALVKSASLSWVSESFFSEVSGG